MNTKLTQKELVDLFNQGAAPFQQAIVEAELKYKEALILFATKYLEVPKDEWQEGVEDYMADLVSQDFVIEACSDDLRDDIPNHYLAHEYAIRHSLYDISEDWNALDDLNTKA